MASKTFSGQLDQAMNEAAAEGNKILFIPQQTVGEVLPGAASELVVESDGTYSIKLAYNTYSIYHYSDVTKRKTLLANDIVVSTDTAVTTIPDLLGSVVPVTEDSVLTIQGYLDEANDAKDDAEAAQAATEALFTDFDSSVAESMSLIHTETPSLSIPFNESGRLDYGVGTEYVSGLPIYGVDFTRSTTSTVVNKSGVLETLAADEIGIGSDGAWFHDAYTNLVLYSEDFSQSEWTKTSATATATTDTTDPTGGSGAYLCEISSESGVIQQVVSVTSGDTYTLSAFLKKATASQIYTLWGVAGTIFDFDLGDVVSTSADSYEVEELSNGWFRLSITFEATATSLGIRPIYDSTSTTAPIDCYVYGVQLVEGSSVLPYLSTSSTTTTTASASATLTTKGNVPSVGQSHTITVDAEFPDVETGNVSLLTFSSDVSGGVISLRKNTGSVQWVHDYSDGSIAAISTTNDDYRLGRHRYVMVFDGDSDTFNFYCDGDLIGTRTTNDYCWYNPDGLIYICNAGYNNMVKNFKILPYAASADEVKSWGATK